ncbi:MAG: hypothetical protein LBN18_03080 [Dysgonamonadaceae bacterium]|jgi:hypothetical protein|nr:hypothetical protein [Dysgonamonadaceae bacterium]
MKSTVTSLEDIKKENPFRTPEGYFDQLTSQIMSQLPEKIEPEAKIVPLWSRIKPWMYAAAAIAGITLTINLLGYNPFANKGTLNLTSASEIDEFYQYYEEQFADQSYHETFYVE